MSEIKIVLHAAHGDVVTVYPASQLKQALACIEQYILDQKQITVTHR